MGKLSKLSPSLVRGYLWNNHAECNDTATTVMAEIPLNPVYYGSSIAGGREQLTALGLIFDHIHLQPFLGMA